MVISAFETGSLKNKILYDHLHKQLEILGKKLNLLIQAIERNINQRPETSFQKPVNRITTSVIKYRICLI